MDVKPTPVALTKAQFAALCELAKPRSEGLHLIFNRPELGNIGAAFIQLVDMGYAHESRIHANWVKFTITKKGKRKWAEVSSEQASQG